MSFGRSLKSLNAGERDLDLDTNHTRRDSTWLWRLQTRIEPARISVGTLEDPVLGAVASLLLSQFYIPPEPGSELMGQEQRIDETRAEW
jgi:hypothetical protein